MNQFRVKAESFIRRRVIQAVGINPENSISLHRLERPIEVDYDLLNEYSGSKLVEIPDPRNGIVLGHYYQKRSIYQLKNVILEPRQGLVYSEQGKLIRESTQWHHYVSNYFFPWKPSKRIRSLNVKLAISMTCNPYWHWLIEDLPTTLFLLQNYPEATLLVASNPPDYVSEFVTTLNRKIVYLDGPAKIKYLNIVSKEFDAGWPHPSDLDEIAGYRPFIKAMQTESANSKIYVSRTGSTRSPENEKEVEAIFSKHGFEIVRAEELSFLEKIQKFRNVTHLAGIHGAGLVNLIWMQPGTKMLDIANENYWTESVHRAAYLKKINYEFLLYPGNFSGEVALADLESTLTKFID